MNTLLSGRFHTLLDFIFPAECVYCHQFVGDDRILVFCNSCWESIALIPPPRCPRCGSPYASKTVAQYAPGFLCGACRLAPPYFDRAFAATFYEGVAKEAIHQFKFQRKFGLGTHLAHLLLSNLPADISLASYDAILPVPLHRTRQKHRGYNQSAILARHIASQSHLKLLLGNLTRIRATHAQTLLTGKQARKKNVKNAFRINNPDALRGQRIILIDDVVTTGATVNECSRVLKKAHVRSILVLSVSRAGLQKSCT